jgi:hypothetical protein
MHDAFMENPYSETLKAQNIEKPNDIKVFGSTNTKRPKQDSQNRLISPENSDPSKQNTEDK